MTEVIAAVLAAIVGAVLTYVISRLSAPRETPLTGTPLTDMPDYPVKVSSEGILQLNPDAILAVGNRLISEYNPRAAVDLLYLAQRNWSTINNRTDIKDVLDRVRHRYRRFKRLVEPKSIADNREHLLRQFYNITEGLGDTFAGVPIEFVLHDTRDPIHSVCVIKNSITGRKKGDPTSVFGEDVIVAFNQARWTGTQHSYRLRHPQGGQEIKATTIPLQDPTLGLIAFLCINIDIEKLSPGSPGLPGFAAQLVATPGGWGAQLFDVQDSNV